MANLFFFLAINCSICAVVFGIRGLMGKGHSNWKLWCIAITLYAVFMIIGFILRG